ncbi:MAG: protein-methionine-sulfoxide reductase catalytic subunit MsrP, partial [Burkholderiales bacterium]
MSIRPAPDVASSEITPKSVYLRRRAFLEQALAIGLVWPLLPAQAKAADARKLPGRPGPFSTSEKKTSYKDVTTYNNFYEFGTGKDEPAIYAPKMNTRPWAVTVDGEVKRGGVFSIEDLLKLAPMQDRIYRHRCVEAWSMVIPW